MSGLDEHPNRRTESVLKAAEAYVEKKSVYGVATHEGGLIRQLIGVIMEHANALEEAKQEVRDYRDRLSAAEAEQMRQDKAVADRIRAIVGNGIKHKGGSAGVYEFSPDGTSTEFWGYINAVAYTGAVNEILLLLDPDSTFGRATTYAGGRDKPRTLDEALAEEGNE